MDKESNVMSGQIAVHCLGMDARKEAMLRMAFKIHQKRKFYLLEKGVTDHADIAIADLDSTDGLHAVQNFHRDFPQKPILGLSVSPDSFPGLTVIRKPIQMETLFPALDKLLPTGDRPSKYIMPTAQPALATRTKAEEEGMAPTRTKDSEHPVRPEVAPFDPKTVQYFDPKEGLLGRLELVMRDKIAASIVDDTGNVLWRIFPADNLVETWLSSQEAKDILPTSDKLSVSTVKPFPDSREVYRETVDEFMWKISHIIANGRLSSRIHLNRPIKLKQWPNLTRLSPLPEALRLSAFYARSPASPILTIRMLQIDPTILFNYLAAIDSLGIIQYQSESIANSAALPLELANDTAMHGTSEDEPKKVLKRGLLGRLLAKIAGL